VNVTNWINVMGSRRHSLSNGISKQRNLLGAQHESPPLASLDFGAAILLTAADATSGLNSHRSPAFKPGTLPASACSRSHLEGTPKRAAIRLRESNSRGSCSLTMIQVSTLIRRAEQHHSANAWRSISKPPGRKREQSGEIAGNEK
jgi:hypothetical protein